MYWNCKQYLFQAVNNSVCTSLHILKHLPLTSLSWSSALASCSWEARPAGWALLSWRSWGSSPTWLSRRSGYCSDWRRWLHWDLVQDGVIARQVACKRWRRSVVWDSSVQNSFWVCFFFFFFLNWILILHWDFKKKQRCVARRRINNLVLMCKRHWLLTLDELFTHLPCDGAHSSLGLHITLKKKTKKHGALNSLILHDHTVDATRPATFLLEQPQLHKSPDQWLINWWAGVLWVFKWVYSTFVRLTEASLYLYWPLQIAHLWQQSREDLYYIEIEIRLLFFKTFGHNLVDFDGASTELIFYRRSTHFKIDPLFLLQLIGGIGSGKCIKMLNRCLY